MIVSLLRNQLKAAAYDFLQFTIVWIALG